MLRCLLAATLVALFATSCAHYPKVSSGYEVDLTPEHNGENWR